MKSKEWLEYAEKRLRAAESLFNDSIYEDSLFMCHQSIEMAFKAVIIKKTGLLPPKTHSLQQLARLAGFNELGVFSELEPVYAGIRYPDAPKIEVTNEEVERNIKLSRRVFKWSESQIK